MITFRNGFLYYLNTQKIPQPAPKNPTYNPTQLDQPQRLVTDIGDYYTLKCSFNGAEIFMSLTYYRNEVVTVFEGFFAEQDVDRDLVAYYGSWENVYVRCFQKRFMYEIVAQGSSKLIQLAYKVKGSDKEVVRYQKFPLSQIQVTSNIQIQKLKQIITRKNQEKLKNMSQIGSLKKKIKAKDIEIQKIKLDMQQMDKLCNQACIPLFVKTKDLLMIQRGHDPNQILYKPLKPDAKPAYLILRNQISAERPFILKINFEPIMRTEHHSIGIVDEASINNIPNAQVKIAYQFKGEMVFGLKNKLPCEDMRIMNYTEIQMKVDFKGDLVEFRRGNQRFATAHLENFRGKVVRPFVKIGQQGVRYHLTVLS